MLPTMLSFLITGQNDLDDLKLRKPWNSRFFYVGESAYEMLLSVSKTASVCISNFSFYSSQLLLNQ